MQFSFIHYSFIMRLGFSRGWRQSQRLKRGKMQRDKHSHMDVCLGLSIYHLTFCLSPKQTKNNCQFQVNCLFTLVMANREIVGAIIHAKIWDIRGELWYKCRGNIHLHRTNNWGNGEIFVIGPKLAITFTPQTKKQGSRLVDKRISRW